MKPRARIVYHGHCFDGMSSAVLMTRVLRALEGPSLSIDYRGLDHQPGGSKVPEAVLDADVNAVVDFRYTQSKRLHYWFDHHVSGLRDEREREHFAADESGRKFFDDRYGSCCKLIADVAHARFDLEWADLAGLIQTADEIDAARFANARSAVELASPALQLMTVIELHGDDAFLAPRIEALDRGASIDELAHAPDVQTLFAPLRAEHERTIDAIGKAARVDGAVVSFDLVGSGTERFNKFIPYYLYPHAAFAVAVSAGPRRVKVSVGTNPWAAPEDGPDIAAICARYGGGGHRVVGAISFRPDEIGRARLVAAEVAAVLAGEHG